MLESFFERLEEIFTVEKIRGDLLSYLHEVCGSTTSPYFVISSQLFSGEEKESYFVEDEKITISSIEVCKSYLGQANVPYTLEVIVGDFECGLGPPTPAKFKADMLYGDDFRLITVDFIHI